MNLPSFEDFISKNVLNNNNFAFMAQLSLKGMVLVGLAPNLKQAEEMGWENQITSYTIEDGTNVSDHIINGPLEIKQKFILTALPPVGFLFHLRFQLNIVILLTFPGARSLSTRYHATGKVSKTG
ncbi:MAG: hypothetical protein LBJ96_00640 [Holosporaceae bacterium]|jgi:hypothetical protein|nr:hypothetical protein [Holosporaceae bacterium]